MEQVEGLTVARCGASPFLRPYTLRYRQNGTQKAWDFMRTHDSVAVLIFNSTQQSFVLVKQFRPAVYMAELGRRCPEAFPDGGPDDTRDLGVAGVTLPSTAGVTYELWRRHLGQAPTCPGGSGLRRDPGGVWLSGSGFGPEENHVVQVGSWRDRVHPDHVLRGGDGCHEGERRRRPARGRGADRGGERPPAGVAGLCLRREVLQDHGRRLRLHVVPQHLPPTRPVPTGARPDIGLLPGPAPSRPPEVGAWASGEPRPRRRKAGGAGLGRRGARLG
uniref:Nudix hydrolase domain-containing protein n=1 Tax=Ornithorhynchus anatinus TaxID=9258 RepID=A0A6I8P8X2_ORNAN